MEHSYTRDWQPTGNAEVMATRTILIERPPQCPSCHLLPNHEEKIDIPEISKTTLPEYDEDTDRMPFDEIEHIVTHCHNRNADDEDWVEKINKLGWTDQQIAFFNRIEQILDLDRMAQLAVKDRTNECLRRRAITDKSVSRMRLALTSVHWEPSLTQWLHGLLVKHLPPSYMASYITILQGLKAKVPTLVDKMLFSRPIDFHQDCLGFILKQPWEPNIKTKSRQLPANTTIIVVPSSPVMHTPLGRLQKWYQLLGTMAKVVQIQVNISHSVLQKHSLDHVTDQMVAITRAKIQEIRYESQKQHIILIGFNAGAAIALQVALVETVDSVVCLGFAYNTIKGVRGAQDDRILELTTPVLFILGQNAQRSSQEEIESLREQMSAQTSLVVIGSADDLLRVDTSNRQLEGATQSMIDDMIVDEIQEFTNTCIINPPGPRQPKTLNTKTNGYSSKAVLSSSSKINSSSAVKRPKSSNGYEEVPVKKNLKAEHCRYYPDTEKRKTVKRIINTSDSIHQMNTDDLSTLHPINELEYEIIASGDDPTNNQILQSNSKQSTNGDITKSNIITLPVPRPNIRQKVKFVPMNQFVHIKPPPVNTQKIYVKTPSNGTSTDSYTLGVSPLKYSEETISEDVTANKLITVKNKKMSEKCFTTTTTYENGATRKNGANNVLNYEKAISIPNDSDSSENTYGSECTMTSAADSDLFGTNILDIPILFADSEGNIEEEIEIMNEIDTSAFHMASPNANNNENQLIGNGQSDVIDEVSDDAVESFTAINILPNKPETVTTKNNVVILNGNSLNRFKSNGSAMKTSSNQAKLSKYTEVIIPSNKNINLTKLHASSRKSLAPGTKIDLSKLVKYGRNSHAIQVVSTTNGSATVTSSAHHTTIPQSLPSFQTITRPKNARLGSPIVMNVNGNKPALKNIIKLQPTDRLKFRKSNGSNNNIVIRQNDFQKVSTLEPGFVNRNITVRKISVVKKPSIEIQSIEHIDNLNDEIEILEAAESLLETYDDDLEYSSEMAEM